MTDPTPSVIAGALSEEERAFFVLLGGRCATSGSIPYSLETKKLMFRDCVLDGSSDDPNVSAKLMWSLTDLGREVAAELQKRG